MLQRKILIFLLPSAHYMWAETFLLLWAFRNTLYLDIFVSTQRIMKEMQGDVHYTDIENIYFPFSP